MVRLFSYFYLSCGCRQLIALNFFLFPSLALNLVVSLNIVLWKFLVTRIARGAALVFINAAFIFHLSWYLFRQQSLHVGNTEHNSKVIEASPLHKQTNPPPKFCTHCWDSTKKMSKKKVLIVGGTGYLGQHLLQAYTHINGAPYDLAFTHHSSPPPQVLLDAVSGSLAFPLDLKSGNGFDAILNTFGQVSSQYNSYPLAKNCSLFCVLVFCILSYVYFYDLVNIRSLY